MLNKSCGIENIWFVVELIWSESLIKAGKRQGSTFLNLPRPKKSNRLLNASQNNKQQPLRLCIVTAVVGSDIVSVYRETQFVHGRLGFFIDTRSKHTNTQHKVARVQVVNTFAVSLYAPRIHYTQTESIASTEETCCRFLYQTQTQSRARHSYSRIVCPLRCLCTILLIFIFLSFLICRAEKTTHIFL